MEAVVKPDRYPDYVASYGSAFWFAEMIYAGATGSVMKMMYDEDRGKLVALNSNGEPFRDFNPEIQVKRDQWWYDTFEKHVLGDNSE